MAIKIYIDQGHNPQAPNTGAEGNGLREQDITYDVGQRLANLLRQNGNFEVRLSRPTPQTQLGNSNASSLRTRVNEANSWGADYFVSIHTNASSQASANGTEVLVYTEPSTSANLAEDILREVTEITGLESRGVKERPGLYVLRKTTMPAVLVELGFITNTSDAIRMRDNPGLFARGIYQGILDFLNL
ncbi:MAG: N-acetylmuramoyl-L-alanine amidase [Ruminococcaceae bacterium]|nr:N-acetylmuramoyl-L-alanine amidase [Oscillospiraceae bacterium]